MTDTNTWQNRILDYKQVPVSDLLANPLNARRHPSSQRIALRDSLDTLGWVAPVIVNVVTGYMLDGHARAEELLTKDEFALIPVIEVQLTEAEEKIFLASFDWITHMAQYDNEILDALLQQVNTTNEGLQTMLAEMAEAQGLYFGDAQTTTETTQRPSLSDRFLVPPFSVLDARQGYWQKRKGDWLELGLQGEIGRNGVKSYNTTEWVQTNSISGNAAYQSGVSIFDPVLCELMYRWFCPTNGLIVNPTAGESVYGIVAGVLGYQYKGVELRQEQIDANRLQAVDIGVSDKVIWIQGNGQAVDNLVQSPCDFIMCCPPYYDLEIYSENEQDISNAETYEDFLIVYRDIIANSVKLLKDNRFACFVVGDIRDKQGNYRNFVSDTIAAFLDAGVHLYNEAIFITPAGSLPIRAGKQFVSGRKLGKTHQNVLVFCKGDWKQAVADCGEIVIDDSIFSQYDNS